jgi:membrane-associated protease RseP (regulator of RpoE activity)
MSTTRRRLVRPLAVAAATLQQRQRRAQALRGRPAPEAIRVAATFVGLAMIASLMLFVIFLDVQKRL